MLSDLFGRDGDDQPVHYEVENLPPGTSAPSTLDVVLNCKSDHTKYIPVKNFGLSDLPNGIRCPETFSLVALNIDLAVKVSVKKAREQSIPARELAEGGEIEEPGQKCGSGSICYFSDTHNLFPCHHIQGDACQMCHIPSCPYIDSLGIGHFVVTSHASSLTDDQMARAHLAFRVSTNLHVVNDDEAARNASIELFYHTEDEPGDVVTAKGVCLCEIWEEQDKVHVVCVTDMDTRAMRLLQCMRQNMRQLFASIPAEVKRTFIKNYVIVVSHPHGAPKVVSVGKKDRCEHKTCSDGRRYTETSYYVETCLGSSGAPVVGPGWEDGGPGYRVHVGFKQNGGKNKIGLSKSFWVVDSDERGGAGPNPITILALGRNIFCTLRLLILRFWYFFVRLFLNSSKKKLQR